MDFDDAKENIQPLAQGRNPAILQASIRVDSQQELMAQRKELEREIHRYTGDDPLSPWYTYIEWIEQSFPSGGKESGLLEVLAKCLSRFEKEEKYFQDRRMIRLYIKYLDGLKNPGECYQQLYKAGIGTMVSDFYMAWAYCYDLVDNTRKADEIFRLGIACRAQPLEELQEAHQHFGFTVAQRLMYKDDDNIKEETTRQLHERRQALSSLRGHRRKQLVGSTRTGDAVKNNTPGVVKADGPSASHQRNNNRVDVYSEENACPNTGAMTVNAAGKLVANEESRSVVRSIIDSQREQENLKEPGPWNKPHKKGKLFGKSKVTNELGFEIHEDGVIADEEHTQEIYLPDTYVNRVKPIRLPPNFCHRNRPQCDWVTPVTTDENRDQNTIPQYNKCKLYPRPNMEFQLEEYKAYVAFQKRNISNQFTSKRDLYWGRGPRYNIRLYPHFAKQSKPQKVTELDAFYMPQKIQGMQLTFPDIYNVEEKVERQYEEILYLRVKRNETIIQLADMEETVCVPSEKVQRRKSFFPMRRSIAPCATAGKGAIRKVSTMPGCMESDEDSANVSKKIATSSNELSAPAIFSDRESIEVPKLFSGLTRQRDSEAVRKEKEIDISKSHEVPKLFSGLIARKDPEPLRNEKDIEMPEVLIKQPLPPAVPPQVLTQEHPKEVVKFMVPKPTLAAPTQFSEMQMPTTTPKSCAPIKEVVKFMVPKPSLTVPTHFSEMQMPTTPKSCAPIKDGSFAAKSSVPTSDDQFQFKTPGLPPSVSNIAADTVAKSNKISFEIFEDNTANNLPKPPEASLESRGYFDGDESCSTQTFNIFLKAQSVSTPKPKPEPQKQFGNVLKETIPPTPAFDQIEEEFKTAPVALTAPSEVNDENSPVASSAVFSPHRKQLSTILETSENGTTQSTHTTGATTKSTLSSPEFDHEIQGKSTQPTLDTVRERTFESSIVESDGLEDKFSSMNVGAKTAKNEICSIKGQSVPGEMRSETTTNNKLNAASDFAIFEDPVVETAKGNVGNFSRLEENQETATGYALKPVHFQEDKTETMTKFVLPQPHSGKFQDDKTETISLMFLPPSQPLQFPEDTTETISKLLLPPPQPIRFEDDRTETLPQLPGKETSMKAPKAMDDDLFEFFSQSPPKAGKVTIFNPFEKKTSAEVRTAAASRTPVAMNPKRLCNKDTPDMHKVQPIFTNVAKPKSVLRDSFMPDFSIIEDTQPNPTKPKSVLRDSFLPDFSIIENTQPQEQKKQSKLNETHLPDLSYIPETQCSRPQKVSLVPDPQPTLPSTSGRKGVDNSLLPECVSIPETQRQESASSYSKEGQPSGLKNILTDTFMNDFSEIKEPLPLPIVGEMNLMQPVNNNSTLKYLEESNCYKPIAEKSSKYSNEGTGDKLNFNPPSARLSKHSVEGKKILENQKFFELNAETEMFGPNSSMIKNSTWLPNHGPMRKRLSSKQPAFEIQEDSIHLRDDVKQDAFVMPSLLSNRVSDTPGPNKTKPLSSYQPAQQIQRDSIHIKDEIREECSLSSSSAQTSSKCISGQLALPMAKTTDLTKPKLSSLEKTDQATLMSASRFSIDISQSELDAINNAKKQQQQLKAQSKSQTQLQSQSYSKHEVGDKDEDFGEMSIYYRHTPKTPKAKIHVWDDEEGETFKTPTNNRYTYAEPDMNQTLQILENVRMDPNVNPFSVDLINAFLDQIQFTNYIQNIPQCMLVGSIHRIKAESRIVVNNVQFQVEKLIGEGAYGAVFLGRESTGGKKVAMKQEKPPNLWEYYICLEIRDRIQVDEMLPAFMSVDYAVVGNNSSVLISNYSPFGSIITVCNKIKKHTLKNVDEYVVMVMACELLEIIDHLHAISIIHADVKADNFLIMNKLGYLSKERSLQLIDFGVSIDMKLFKPKQTFSYVHTDNTFKCVEMREQRPWTYQLDLYGLAGVLHVLLFGKYMDVAQKPSGIWMHKTHVPRYFNRNLWDSIFKALLNIRDCNSMPNLQDLRASLKQEIEEKEKYVTKMLNEFNRILAMQHHQ